MKKQLLLLPFLLLLGIDTNIYAVTQRTEPFIQEVRTFFRVKDGLTENKYKECFLHANYGCNNDHSGNIQNPIQATGNKFTYIIMETFLYILHREYDFHC
jgi:hypothetical protein